MMSESEISFTDRAVVVNVKTAENQRFFCSSTESGLHDCFHVLVTSI